MRFYLLSLALALGLAASADAQTPITTSEATQSIIKGERLPYILDLEAGGYVEVVFGQISIDVVVDIFLPNDSFLTSFDIHGVGRPEVWEHEPDMTGTYRFEVYAFESDTAPIEGNFSVKAGLLRSAEEQTAELAAREGRRQDSIQWIRENAIPLATVEAESSFADMQPLKQVVGEARIVALGEATHGTREFFQLKHRMLEFLATEMEFDVFAIEATMPESFDVNEYVLNGRGDPEKALSGLYLWTWDTEEVLEMIRWMRRFNMDPANKRKLKFYGVDMLNSVRAFKVVHERLLAESPEDAVLLAEHPSIKLLGDPRTEDEYRRLPREEHDRAVEFLRGLLDRWDSTVADSLGTEGWRVARQHGEILIQTADRGMYTVGHRDSSMAANVAWILDHEGPDSKLVYWAHNIHVSTEPPYTGQRLRDAFGEEMVVFGLAFDEGSFQSGRSRPNPQRFDAVVPFHVQSLESSSWDATMGEVGLSVFALDLRQIPSEGPVGDWLAESRATRFIGAGFWPPQAGRSVSHWPSLYDAMLFVSETTSARPNPGGGAAGPPMFDHDANLGFETGSTQTQPYGWRTSKYRQQNLGYSIGISDTSFRSGKQSLVISRDHGEHYGEIATRALQSRVRPNGAIRASVSAYVNAELEGEASSAFLVLISGQRRSCINTTEGGEEDGSGWSRVVVVCDLHEYDSYITFGAGFSGYGTAWFDDFEVEWTMADTDD
jgi:erythromycin esterase-like protein